MEQTLLTDTGNILDLEKYKHYIFYPLMVGTLDSLDVSSMNYAML